MAPALPGEALRELAQRPRSIFTVAEQRSTARAYGTTAEVFDGMGHNLMVEPGWERVADRIDTFARSLVTRDPVA